MCEGQLEMDSWKKKTESSEESFWKLLVRFPTVLQVCSAMQLNSEQMQMCSFPVQEVKITQHVLCSEKRNQHKFWPICVDSIRYNWKQKGILVLIVDMYSFCISFHRLAVQDCLQQVQRPWIQMHVNTEGTGGQLDPKLIHAFIPPRILHGEQGAFWWVQRF